MSKRLLKLQNSYSSIFAASAMCMDFLQVNNDIEILNNEVDMLHVDIMDGHFVPNITLSPDFIKIVRPATDLPIEAHLMVTNPDSYIQTLLDNGVDCISVHLETINTNAFRLMTKIKDSGCSFGIVLNPATPLDYAQELLEYTDILTIMTVDAGYAGQPFIKRMLNKIYSASQLKLKNNYNYIIQADGACGPKTYKELFNAGVQSFVLGSSGLFGRAPTLNQSCKVLKKEFSDIVGGKLANG